MPRICSDAHVAVDDDSVEVLFLPCGSWSLNSGPHAWQKASTAEPFCQSYSFFFETVSHAARLTFSLLQWPWISNLTDLKRWNYHYQCEVPHPVSGSAADWVHSFVHARWALPHLSYTLVLISVFLRRSIAPKCQCLLGKGFMTSIELEIQNLT